MGVGGHLPAKTSGATLGEPRVLRVGQRDRAPGYVISTLHPRSLDVMSCLSSGFAPLSICSEQADLQGLDVLLCLARQLTT